MPSIIVPDKKNYGYPFPDGLPQFHKEIFGYVMQRGCYQNPKATPDTNYGKLMQSKMGINIDDYHFLSPLEHFCNAVRLNWGSEFELEVRGYKNTSALRIFEALCFEKDVAIAGPASVSKSYPVAAFAYLDWRAAPQCTSTFVATTTLGASEDRIWGMIGKLHRASNFPMGHNIDYRKMIVFMPGAWSPDKDDPNDKTKDYTNAIKALAFEPGLGGQQAVATTRGRKNTRVRLFIDELAEMEKLVLNARSNLRANTDFLFAGIGNPLPTENPHTELCQPDHPLGYDSVNETMDGWKTRTGVCIFLHGDKSPNFQAPPDEPPPFPYLLTRAKQQDMLKDCYGDEKALDYIRNAKGFAWGLGELSLTIINKTILKKESLQRDVRWTQEGTTLVAGFDTAFTVGGDRCVLTIGRVGRESGSNRKIFQYVGQKVIFPSGGVFEETLAKNLVPLCVEVGVKPVNFGMDISGDGGKISQAIIKEWIKQDSSALDIYGISSSGSPTTRTVSAEDKRKAFEAYDRLVTEYWFNVYHALNLGVLVGIDPESELAGELCSRRYGYKNKKLAAETKKEMKMRMGKSPDMADSLVYALLMAMRAGVEFIGDDKAKENARRRFFDDPEPVYAGFDEADYGSDDWGEE
jgi:hypothetical protein